MAENQDGKFKRVGDQQQFTFNPRVSTGVHVYEPIAGYDKVTLAAAMCVLGSWALLLIIGAQLSWGNMSTYFASYFHYLGAEVTMAQFYKV